MSRNCQSSANSAITVAARMNTELVRMGTVSVTAADSSETSSVERLTRSPEPASSTRWVGSPSAVPTMSWRRLAITRSATRETR